MATETSRSATAYDFDCLVFIGRFQPPHLGHLAIIREALKRARQVIVLVGSSWQARSLRNPWRFDERQAMLRAGFDHADNQRLEITPLLDALYNDDVWVRDVQRKVRDLAAPANARLPRIGLIGASRGQSSYYLSLFPQWESVSVPSVEGISASQIRERLFRSPSSTDDYLSTGAYHDLPPGVVESVKHFCNERAYQRLLEEQQLLDQYRQAWVHAPYPPIFVTVNAVVVQSGHVLLVRRTAAPGKGLYTLPGGFINPHERLLDACLRELRERIRLKVPEPVLKGSLRGQRLFDEPHRSWRGRTLAEAFYFALRPDQQLPRLKPVKGGDHARWVALADLEPDSLFEDHFFIIQNFLGLPADFGSG
ncbi:bifunctional nicotinamide-nucleotide adenylyltransferase/Nudix hydroxylase [Halomonas sp. ISL-60]|uniref:bifunctional nicotinamide-nucleotide adenylyltransferase/Nudix hydroxylase n=1 Tax=unclassified Halomonas TaxID=2609666 RepID=UPI0007D9761C|nr:MULTISPECIES: bifunctional nicotinamide-nucleotide adenylyltransferase/Nudix hydroxylase [unclassified Halomonas]MBT2774499.1 bifunctional nicotinamide-nucleotide adenylyltransferase/Nudix hydroxylase [Halomonas sp. ISL-60]MBT2787947.1 bifunctional nicotinamide-nucleotide adenylyltransferase/Nudix hydroxylase [Halomonas sp. ISL-106]MBT2795696.1 bifunctional nicotinamide-nucleotide adenylyltransferase/Nudix hydroxylase [Halomonas sp. ISL-104]MBT2802253.1 bifunctional nicotinamide-nucleotide a